MRAGAALLFLAAFLAGAPDAGAQTASVSGALFTPRMLERTRVNAERYTWAADIRGDVISAAAPWLKYSDGELWDMMFGATITRSWMVWSDGFCPSCGKDVRMYAWKMDALARPWKVKCPNCGGGFEERFRRISPVRPRRTRGVRSRAGGPLAARERRASRSGDSLRTFGVDDGEGYVRDGKRWRFIGGTSSTASGSRRWKGG